VLYFCGCRHSSESVLCCVILMHRYPLTFSAGPHGMTSRPTTLVSVTAQATQTQKSHSFLIWIAHNCLPARLGKVTDGSTCRRTPDPRLSPSLFPRANPGNPSCLASQASNFGLQLRKVSKLQQRKHLHASIFYWLDSTAHSREPPYGTTNREPKRQTKRSFAGSPIERISYLTRRRRWMQHRPPK
jgi:hypothetical protein